MSVVHHNLDEKVYQAYRREKLHDLEIGALITLVTLGVAYYVDGIIMLLIGVGFLFVELCNSYDFVCLCKDHKKDAGKSD